MLAATVSSVGWEGIEPSCGQEASSLT
jgi:hypothetical protein